MDPIYVQADKLQTDQEFQKAYGVYSKFILIFAMYLLFFVIPLVILMFCSFDKNILFH